MTETFLEFRETLWGVADGREILIKDLALDHLVNIINWVKDRPKQYNPELYPLLEQEANYRKTIQFAAGLLMPTKGEDGVWYLRAPTGDIIEPSARSNYTDPVDNPNK